MLNVKQKSNSVVSAVVDEIKGEIVFSVIGAGENGGNATKTLTLSKIHEKNKQRAIIHGFKARVVDAAAIAFNKVTNKYASPQEKFAAMSAIIEHLESGSEEWNLKRAQIERETGGELVRAIIAAYPEKDVNKVKEAVKNWDKETKLSMEMRPEIRAELDKIRNERAKNVNTDELLGELA